MDKRTPLAKKLAARIVASGPISLFDYMEACLYDPKHGYYRNQVALGRGGDFITAPEICQVYGELAGLWVAAVWQQMPSSPDFRLIELGPGRGTLMADALRALQVAPGFFEKLSLHLIEASQTLKEAQRRTLAGAPCPIFWHDTIDDVPEGASICIANEFLDCLPVRQFVFDARCNEWRERMIALENGEFKFVPGDVAHPAPFPLGGDGWGEGEAPVEDGSIVERRPGAEKLMASFAKRSAKAHFAALIADYGYSRPSLGNTVQAVKSHKFVGIFDFPGESDISAHVDFSHLMQSARLSQLDPFGPMPIGQWLLRLGLEERIRQLLARAAPEIAADLKGRVARLIDPAQMGVLFKVVALTDGGLGLPPPFCRSS